MKPKSRLNWFPAAGACVVTVCIQAVHAVDRSWDGSDTTYWNTAANWSTDTVPTSGDKAFVNTNSGNIATITADVPNVAELLVGIGASGKVNHTAGSLTANSWLIIGSGGSGTGVYNLTNTSPTGGTLTGFGLGAGSLTKTSGGNFYVGENGAQGTLNINTTGGVTSNGFTTIGQGGTGIVNLDAGFFTVNGGDANIGNSGGTGTVNVGSAGTFTSNGWFFMGRGAGSSGTLNMSGGTVNANSVTLIGDGGTGIVNVDAGVFVTGGADTNIGNGSGGTGTVNIGSAGTFTTNGWLFLGRGAGASGTLNMSGGTVNSNSVTIIGEAGSGIVNVNAGVFTAATDTHIGRSGGTGTLNIGSTGTFTANSTLVVGSDGGTGTLNMSGGTVNQGTLNTGSRLELTNGGSAGNATVNLNGGTLAVNGIVANGTGAGTVLLNLNGGTLKANIANNDFINAGNIDRINVRNGGAVIDTNDNNIRIANAILHSNLGGDNATDGGLTKNGAGTLTLSNANTYTGGTTVSAGRIEVTNNTALGSGTVSIAAGANVLLNANSLTIANDITLNGTTSGGALVSGDRPGGNVTTLSGTITLAASSNIASWWNDKTLALSGKITGPGNLTFDRATALGDPVGGKFLISGTTNDYTGSTTVNGKSGGNAILQLGAANALPTGTTLTLNDANLILNGFNQTLGGLVASTTTSQIVNGSATAVTLTVNNAAANTFAGVLGGGGTNENNFALTKGGAGALTLSGANSYTGGTTLNAGTLALGSSGALGTTGTISFGGGTLQHSASNTTDYSSRFSTAASQAYKVDTNGQNVTWATALTSSGGSLTKNGAGQLEIASQNTFTGAVVVNAGTLYANSGTGPNNKAFSYSSGITVNSGATLRAGSNSLFGWDGSQAKAITINGGTAVAENGDQNVGLVTLNGGTLSSVNEDGFWGSWHFGRATDKKLLVTDNSTVSAQHVAFTSGATIEVAAGKNLDFTGTIGDGGGDGPSSVIKEGSGTLTLSGANSYSGGTTLTAGTLALGSSGALGTTGTISFGGGTLQHSASNTTDYSSRFSTAASQAYKVDTNGQNVTWATDLTSSGGSLTKSGNGTLTLSGANTYTGTTTVNAGTLKVSGSIGSSAVTVANNGILASGTTGTIGSSVSVSSGGTLAAGGVGAIGTATVGSGGLALSSGSIFAWDLSGATGNLPTADQGSYDKVVSNGTLSGTSIFNVVLGTSDFTDTFWNSTHTWSDIFTGAGIPTNLAAIFTTFSGTNVNTNGSVTGQGGFSFNGTSTLTWTAVPEPTTALSGLLLTAGLLRRRRKN